MHLGNGAITPECAALTYAAAGAGLAMGAAACRTVRLERFQAAVALGCAVFALQAINVPVTGSMSGHLVGGVLLSWLLGPALGVCTMTIVLTAQALVLGDGGLTALGANVLNMAALPAALIAVAQRFPIVAENSQKSRFVVAGLSGLAVVLAAALIVAETALFRSAGAETGWLDFASRMIGYHVLIGCLEALATWSILQLAQAPIVAKRWQASPQFGLGIAAALVAAAMLMPISTSLPDGYEAAAEDSGMNSLLER